MQHGNTRCFSRIDDLVGEQSGGQVCLPDDYHVVWLSLSSWRNSVSVQCHFSIGADDRLVFFIFAEDDTALVSLGRQSSHCLCHLHQVNQRRRLAAQVRLGTVALGSRRHTL